MNKITQNPTPEVVSCDSWEPLLPQNQNGNSYMLLMYCGTRLVLLGNTLSLVEWDTTHHVLICHSTLVTSTPIILFVEVLKFSQNTSFQEKYLVKENRECFGIFYFRHRIFKISFNDEWFIGVDLGPIAFHPTKF